MKPSYVYLQVTLETQVMNIRQSDSWRSVDRKQSHLEFPVILHPHPTPTPERERQRDGRKEGNG